MELPSTGTVVLFLAFAFVIVAIHIVIRTIKLGEKQAAKRKEARAEIEANAAAHGRQFTRTNGSNTWRQTGVSPKGVAWEMSYSIAMKSHWENAGDPVTQVPDGIQGQLFEWRAAALHRSERAFRFGENTGDAGTKRLVLDAEHPLWQRWQLEVADEALARRTFTPAVCEALAMLPAERASNTLQDKRTAIVLGGEGLVATLGVFDPGPEVVELWIGICENLADAIKA